MSSSFKLSAQICLINLFMARIVVCELFCLFLLLLSTMERDCTFILTIISLFVCFVFYLFSQSTSNILIKSKFIKLWWTFFGLHDKDISSDMFGSIMQFGDMINNSLGQQRLGLYRRKHVFVIRTQYGINDNFCYRGENRLSFTLFCVIDWTFLIYYTLHQYCGYYVFSYWFTWP